MVSVYVDNKKLDLFKDENIKLTSKIADIEKLSNVFMDFTQSFTVPASENNNDILKHYYDLTIDNGYGNVERIDSFIEINTIPFKSGKIQINGARKKNGKIVDYKITFYSDTIQLTEKLGEDTLDMLDLSVYDFDWDSDTFEDGMSDSSFMNGDICIPLICYPTGEDEDKGYYNRIWQIGEGVGGYTMSDITSNNYGIKPEEVRPAIRMYKIIEAIEDKYDIMFSKDFFDMPDFYELFLWLNKREDTKLTNFTIGGFGSWSGTGLNYSTDQGGNFNFNDGTIYYDRRKYGEPRPDLNFPNNFFIFRLIITYDVIPDAGFENVLYTARIIDIDGNILIEQPDVTGTIEITKQWASQYSSISSGNLELITETARLVIIPTQNFEFSATASVFYRGEDDEGLCNTSEPECGVFTDITGTVNDVVLQQKVVISENIPQLTVIDFIQGIMKMFKLVITPITRDSFRIDTIDNFYNTNETIDITPFIDTEEVNIERPELFNNIEFKYEHNDNIQNKYYREEISPNPNLDYGDLKYTTDIEGGKKLEVQLPFSNLLFERLTILDDPLQGETFPVVSGNSAELNRSDNSISPVKMKPVIFYKTADVSLNRDIKLNFFGTIKTLSNLISVNTSNNIVGDNVTNTLSFLATGDPAHDGVINRTLYDNYWDNWINEIYDRKQRKVKVSGYLDLETILKINLSNRIIINDVRYKINDYSINLSTNKVDFNLFKDVFENREYVLNNSRIDGYEDDIVVFNRIKKRYVLVVEAPYGVDWQVDKVEVENYGVNWLTLSRITGTGPTKIWFEVSKKTGLIRAIQLKISTADENKNINIVQL